LPVHVIRQIYPARLAFILNARCNIDAIAKDVVAVDDDIANVDSNPELDAELRPLGRSCRHLLLNRNRASHGIDGARELDQHAVAGSLDNTALMGGDCRIDDLAPMRF
jgi:hypothetical protein